jgi:hypothetical protein
MLQPTKVRTYTSSRCHQFILVNKGKAVFFFRIEKKGS